MKAMSSMRLCLYLGVMRLTREHRHLAVPAVALLVVACSAPPSGPSERVARTSEAIVNGTASPATQNFAVLVEHKVSCTTTGCTYDECTGTLVAPNLVLTARHCVSD